MQPLHSFTTEPDTCGYLPDRDWQLHYEIVAEVSPAEYFALMRDGWRRFGHALFRPVCAHCQECRSLRVPVDRFVPDRSQKRCWKRNHDEIRLVIAEPSVSREKLELYDQFHAFQSDTKGWPWHAPKDPRSYAQSFVFNPFETEEWLYFLDDRLVGVGYVDRLPGGLSAIYFYYDPEERHRGLGTFNVLNVIERTKSLRLPHAYLGFYVDGAASLEYKANYCPNEIRQPDGEWVAFRG